MEAGCQHALQQFAGVRTATFCSLCSQKSTDIVDAFKRILRISMNFKRLRLLELINTVKSRGVNWLKCPLLDTDSGKRLC